MVDVIIRTWWNRRKTCSHGRRGRRALAVANVHGRLRVMASFFICVQNSSASLQTPSCRCSCCPKHVLSTLREHCSRSTRSLHDERIHNIWLTERTTITPVQGPFPAGHDTSVLEFNFNSTVHDSRSQRIQRSIWSPSRISVVFSLRDLDS